jgi:hypothetical protein
MALCFKHANTLPEEALRHRHRQSGIGASPINIAGERGIIVLGETPNTLHNFGFALRLSR